VTCEWKSFIETTIAAILTLFMCFLLVLVDSLTLSIKLIKKFLLYGLSV